MNAVWSLIKQDYKLLKRNAMFWVISASLVLIVLAVNFVIPAEFSAGKPAMTVFGLDIMGEGITRASSAEEVRTAVQKTGSVGIIYHQGKLEILHDGMSEQALTALAAALMPSSALGADIDVEILRPQQAIIPQNKRMMPAFISFEALVIGFLMAAILLLGEKQEMVLKAYRISPGGTVSYIISKTLLFSAIGMLYALLMTVLTIGIGFSWGEFLLLSFLGCALYTLLGLSLAVFFRDMSSWFFSAVLILSINMLPMVSYSVPSFSPAGLRLIPSYSIIFSYSRILFQGAGFAGSTLLLLTCEIAFAALLCGFLVKHKLLSAG